MIRVYILFRCFVKFNFNGLYSAQYVHQHGTSFVISKISVFPSYSSLSWSHFYCTLVSFIAYLISHSYV